MKFRSSLLFLVLTAGLVALAATNARPQAEAADVRLEDVDAWFV